MFDGVRYRKVQIVLEADRNHAQDCRVASVDAEVLRCRRFLFHTWTFPRKQIISISTPSHCVSCTLSPILLAVSGSLIVGGFFAGPAAPVLWVLGGLTFSAAGAIAVGDNFGPSDLLYPAQPAKDSPRGASSAELFAVP